MEKTLYTCLKCPIERHLRFYSSGSGAGSGESVSRPAMSPQDMIQLYQSSLPSTLQTVAGQAPGTANALAGSAAQANPTYTASGLSQLNQFAPGYQQAGANLSNAQAGSTTQQLQGNAGQAAGAAVNLNNQLNPTQAASNTQAQNLLSAISLNGLSPGEANATERSNNQNITSTGNLGLNNGTNAISNAMNFGGAFNSKVGLLSNALGAAGGVANNQNTQVNPVNTAFQSMNTGTNFGLGTFNPTQANSTLTTPFSFASSLGNQVAGASTAATTRSNNSNSSASGGCFLTTACCEFMGLPDDCIELQTLRAFRDKYVPAPLVQEYYKIATLIVEKLKLSEARNVVYNYVWNTVQDCVKLIKEQSFGQALNRYKLMVDTLKHICHI